MLADIDERRSGIPQKLGCPMQSLPCGDYIIPALAGGDGDSYLVGLERKAVPNLTSSINSGQLSDQLSRMLQSFRISILLTEGYLRYDLRTGTVHDSQHDTRFNNLRLKNFLLAWQLRGIVLEFTVSEAQTVHRLQEMEKFFLSAPAPEYIKRKLFSFSMRDSPILRVVSNFTLVGPERAQKLLLELGSVANIVNASVPTLRAIPGIGPKIAQLIYDESNQQYTG